MPYKDKEARNANARKNAARRAEELRSADPERALAHLAKENARQKKWQRENREKHLASSRAWREENKERLAELRRKRKGSVPQEEWEEVLALRRTRHADYMVQWNKTDAGQRARCKRALYQNKHGYSLTIDEYDEMYQLQQGKCAICRERRPQYGQYRMHVDHGHVGGQIRGLLCTNCNSALGKFKDNTIILNTAIQYLTQRGL